MLKFRRHRWLIQRWRHAVFESPSRDVLEASDIFMRISGQSSGRYLCPFDWESKDVRRDDDGQDPVSLWAVGLGETCGRQWRRLDERLVDKYRVHYLHFFMDDSHLRIDEYPFDIWHQRKFRHHVFNLNVAHRFASALADGYFTGGRAGADTAHLATMTLDHTEIGPTSATLVTVLTVKCTVAQFDHDLGRQTLLLRRS